MNLCPADATAVSKSMPFVRQARGKDDFAVKMKMIMLLPDPAPYHPSPEALTQKGKFPTLQPASANKLSMANID